MTNLFEPKNCEQVKGSRRVKKRG